MPPSTPFQRAKLGRRWNGPTGDAAIAAETGNPVAGCAGVSPADGQRASVERLTARRLLRTLKGVRVLSESGCTGTGPRKRVGSLDSSSV